MTPRAVALLLVLTTLSAQAQEQTDTPLRDAELPAPELPWQNYLVPALESATFNLGLLSFSNLVTRMEFARVTPKSLAQNLRPTSWTVDVDYYVTNQFGHAYQGSVYFNAARSSGMNFWGAALYTTLSSLTWELFCESEPPSVNDQITTPIAGSLLGEALHRTAHQLRRGEGTGWLGMLGATLLDPMGALNDALLDGGRPDDLTLDPLFMRWQFGATAGVVVDQADRLPRDRMPPQGLVAVLLVSGPPWDPRSTYDSPLSYFDLRADLSFPSKVVGNIFIRGLLLGRRFGNSGAEAVRRNGVPDSEERSGALAKPQRPGELGRLRGVWGLFGDYDYAAPAIVRASAVGLGPGFIFQLEVLPHLYLQAGGLLGASPFAAAGQLLDVSPDLGRDYHVGPGVQSILDLRVLRPGWFQLELSARNWLVVGAYTAPSGFESITYVTVAASVPIWRWLGVGAEFTLSDRRAHFAGDGGTERDTGLSLRVTLSITSQHFSSARY